MIIFYAQLVFLLAIIFFAHRERFDKNGGKFFLLVVVDSLSWCHSHTVTMSLVWVPLWSAVPPGGPPRRHLTRVLNFHFCGPRGQRPEGPGTRPRPWPVSLVWGPGKNEKTVPQA